MTDTMQQLRAFALVLGLAPLVSVCAATAQPAPEMQQTPPDGKQATPRTDLDPRGRMGPTDRRRDLREEEQGFGSRFGSRFDRNDTGDSRRFDRRSRDRDDWRDRGQRGGREVARDETDWPESSIMVHDRMMMDHGWLMRICGPGGEHIPTFMLNRLERITQPTEGQRAAFDALKDAAARASEMARAACPADQPITPPGRLAAAEKQLEALLQAVRTVRPPMDALYASLSDEQKARLLVAHARIRYWGGRHEQRETGGQGERERDRTFDENRSEGGDPSAGRWREDDRPRRGWRDGGYDEGPPRPGPREFDRDPWRERR